MAHGGISVLNPEQGYRNFGKQSPNLYHPTEDLEEMHASVMRFRRLADPDPFTFVHGVRCLQNWPVHLLSENPQSCVIQYYNRGQVLVRDAAKMEWIYIVKSGSLSVLKKLQEVLPVKENQKKQNVEQEEYAPSEDEEDEYEDKIVDDVEETVDDDEGNNRKKSNYFGTWFYRLQKRRENTRKKRPKLREKEPQSYKNQYEMERRLEQTLPGIYNTRDRLGLIDYESILQVHRSRVLSKNLKGRLKLPGEIQLDKIEEGVQEEENIDEDGEEGDDVENLKLPEIRKTSKGTYLCAKRTKKNATKKRTKKKSSGLRKEFLRGSSEERESGQSKSGETYKSLMAKPRLPEVNVNPMFIVVAILEKGNYFGINHLIYNAQPSFSLVSNGAEVIQISRKLFTEKATDEIMHDLRCNEVPFPKDDEMQSNLQSYVNWCEYRSNVYHRLVQRKLSRDFRRHQYVTQYQGQYCFRAGPA